MVSFDRLKEKKDKKEVKNVGDKEKVDYMALYVHFMYTVIGKFLLSKKRFNEFFWKGVYNKKYEGILKQANIKILPEEYFVAIYVTIVSSIGLVFFSSLFLLILFPVYSVFVFYIGIIGIVVLGIFLYNYPVFRAKERKAEIDAAMPYLLPYMKILSKELNLSKIIEIIDDFLIYEEIRVEFRRIKYMSSFLGYDIHSSIRAAMQSCPSKLLSDMMNDLVTISNSGGDIHVYLERKLENLTIEIEALESKNIETLLIYSQIYVVLLLISPLFYTIMVAVLNLVSFSAESASSGGDNTIKYIMLLLFGLPFLYVGFMMLVHYSRPLYSRLRPIKNI